jgi:hypothetical protein
MGVGFSSDSVEIFVGEGNDYLVLLSGAGKETIWLRPLLGCA